MWRLHTAYASEVYRHFVEEHLDAARQSQKFADLVLAPATRVRLRTRDTINEALGAAMQAIAAHDLDAADQTVTAFRAVAPARPDLVDFRVGFALQLAGLYYAADRLPEARTWALRSMADEARPDAMCLLGEIALAEDDLEGAERWYAAASLVQPVPSRFGDVELVEGRHKRAGGDPRAARTEDSAGRLLRRAILIVVAVRNAEKYIGRCLESVKAQDDYDYHCVVIDDASTDETFRRRSCDGVGTTRSIRASCRAERRAKLFSPQHRRGDSTYGRPGDVVVILDGDDELQSDALENISIAYRRGAWMTYGNFVTSSGKPSWMPPYPQKIVRASAVRQYPWRASHPKTFKIELFNRLTDEDFTHEGRWFETAGDVALMIPMLEMAAERALYIPEPIYVWNDRESRERPSRGPGRAGARAESHPVQAGEEEIGGAVMEARVVVRSRRRRGPCDAFCSVTETSRARQRLGSRVQADRRLHSCDPRASRCSRRRRRRDDHPRRLLEGPRDAARQPAAVCQDHCAGIDRVAMLTSSDELHAKACCRCSSRPVCYRSRRWRALRTSLQRSTTRDHSPSPWTT